MTIKLSTTLRNAVLDSIETTITDPIFQMEKLFVPRLTNDEPMWFTTIQMPRWCIPASYTGISMSSAVCPMVLIDYSRFPHSCPRCKAPAYIGLASVECSQERCR